MSCRRSSVRWTMVVSLAATLALGAATRAAAQGTAGRDGRKSPPLALALSVVLPGAGQFYNGHYLKGAVMFAGAAVAAGAVSLVRIGF